MYWGSGGGGRRQWQSACVALSLRLTRELILITEAETNPAAINWPVHRDLPLVIGNYQWLLAVSRRAPFHDILYNPSNPLVAFSVSHILLRLSLAGKIIGKIKKQNQRYIWTIESDYYYISPYMFSAASIHPKLKFFMVIMFLKRMLNHYTKKWETIKEIYKG